MTISIGVDIGGTFTDLVAAQDGQPWRSLKVPSTPRDPSHGVRNAVRRLIGDTPAGTTAIVRFIHGTTVATNALLEGRGARVGLLTTAGFEDTLEIGRQLRSRDYRLQPRAARTYANVSRAALAPARGVGADRRIGCGRRAARPRRSGTGRSAPGSQDDVEAIAVCFLFSFLNPEHERRTRTLLNELYPHLDIALSCEVDPVAREYERLCMTLTDAYIRPVVSSYIRRLERSLDAHGIDARLQIMQSRGGTAAAGNALRRPVSLVASGPAAGVLGAVAIAERCGIKDAVTIDIGGTSSDVAIVVGSRPLFRRDGVVRGFPLRMTTVDVDSIGAGGGSIAWVDSAGGLRVGPQSAGADPGPACYARGGTDATVTDASVVLGYLNPEYFAGGTVALDADRSRAAISALSSRLGLGLVETALGIHRVVNARMADQIRLRSVRRGYDPRLFALVVLGGAGATHGIDLAVDLGIPRVVVPPAPGVLSAYGLLVANVEHEQIASHSARADEADPTEIDRNCERWRRRAHADDARVGDIGTIVLLPGRRHAVRRSVLRARGAADDGAVDSPPHSPTPSPASARTARANSTGTRARMPLSSSSTLRATARFPLPPPRGVMSWRGVAVRSRTKREASRLLCGGSPGARCAAVRGTRGRPWARPTFSCTARPSSSSPTRRSSFHPSGVRVGGGSLRRDRPHAGGPMTTAIAATP